MNTNTNTNTGTKRYEVIGYTKTGMYAEVVEAATPEAALVKGRPLVRKIMRSGAEVKRWKVLAF
jgi:hypothetical protein